MMRRMTARAPLEVPERLQADGLPSLDRSAACVKRAAFGTRARVSALKFALGRPRERHGRSVPRPRTHAGRVRFRKYRLSYSCCLQSLTTSVRVDAHGAGERRCGTRNVG